MNISAMSNSPYAAMARPPSQESINQRFAEMDADESGGLSIEELSANTEEKGIDQDRMLKMMERADMDGNGEVSQQEMSDMMEKMKEKMKQMGGGFSQSFGAGQVGTEQQTIDDLLESLGVNDDEDNSQSQDIKSFFNKMVEQYPPIDTVA